MKFGHLKTPVLAAVSKAAASKCAICRRSLFLRQLTTGMTRIKMHGSWYCSGSCFASAVDAELSRLRALEPVQPEHVARMSLAHILIGRGLLTEEQFLKALHEQKESGGEIGAVLLGLNLVSETQLTAVRAIQWGCPVFALTNHVNLSHIQFPGPLVRKYSCIPLHYTAARNLLLVGFVHSIEYGLLYLVEQITGYKTEPCFISRADFLARIQQGKPTQDELGDPNPGEIELDRAKTSAEMARVLCESYVEGSLEEAVIGNFRDYIWARLKSGPTHLDFLFDAR